MNKHFISAYSFFALISISNPVRARSLRDSTEAWDIFAAYFSDITLNFTLYMDIGAPVHSAMLVAAGILFSFFAFTSLGYTVVGKSLGANIDPGQVFRSALIIAFLLFPVNYKDFKTASDNPEARTLLAEKIDNEFVARNLNSKDTQQDNFQVTLSFLLLHKLAIGIHELIGSLVESGIKTGGVDSGTGVPYRAFRTFNLTYADVLEGEPETQRAYIDYIGRCNGAVTSPKTLALEVPRHEWLVLGLQGGGDLGMSYGELRNFRLTGTEFTEEMSQSSIFSDDSFFGVTGLEQRHALAPKASQALMEYYPSNLNRPVHETPYKFKTRHYWYNKFQGLPADSNTTFKTFYDNEITGASNPPSDIKDENKSHYYPRSCFQMMLVADRAMAEYRAGYFFSEIQNRKKSFFSATGVVQKALDAFNAGLRLFAKLTGQGTANATSEFQYRTIADFQRNNRDYNSAFGAEKRAFDDAVIAGKATIGILGSSIYEFFQEFKLEYNIPIMAGFLGFLYGLLFVFWPLLIVLAVIYGRGGSLSLSISLFAYLHTVILLSFIIIKIGAVVTVGLQQSINATAGLTMAYNANIVGQAMMAQSMVVMGVLATFPIAYFIIFSDKLSIRGVSSKGYGGDQIVKSAAVAAGAAGFVANKTLSTVKSAGEKNLSERRYQQNREETISRQNLQDSRWAVQELGRQESLQKQASREVEQRRDRKRDR